MAVPIPASEAAMQAVVDYDQGLADALTITDRYSDDNAFMCMLNRIGCGYKERFRMLHDGFDSMQSLVEHFQGGIENFKKHLSNSNKIWMNNNQSRMRGFFTPVLINKLVGVMYYFNTAVKVFHCVPDINQVDSDEAMEYANVYKETILNEDKEDEAKDPQLPELNDAKDWTPFKEAFLHMLSVTYGARKIPLSYLVDNTPRNSVRANAVMVEVDALDLEEDHIFERKAVHFGPTYKQDNTLLWNKLKNALLDKPGYNHISQFNSSKNGRKAWFALLIFYQGENYLKNLKELAFSKLQNTFYRGETNRFTFEKYVNIHKQSHKMLQDAQFADGAGLDNAMKIQYFRAGIKSEAGIEIALSTSRSNSQYDDFDALISFLGAEVEHIKLRKAQLNNTIKRTSSVKRGDKSNKGKPNGKQNGKNKSDRKLLSKFVDGKKVEGRFYSRKEFSDMTPKQRSAVIELKRKSKDLDDRSRNLSQITTDDLITLGDAIVAGVTNASQDNDGEEDQNETRSVSNTTINTRQSGDRSQVESGSVGSAFHRRNKRQRN